MERGRPSRAAGRLSELPMRGQNTRMSTAHITPRREDPSMGRLTMSRQLPQTSEQRISFFGQRTSGASMPRSSLIYGFGGPEKLKDARPLHDKSYVQQCIRRLHEYLMDQGYNVSPKTLQSPSTKEFVKIFEFIYRQLDPTFEMSKSKVEEEVPALLKSLRYPFVLSKSSMYSVGAPHTWPQALGALMWLIDTVKNFTSQTQQDLLFMDFVDDGDNIDDNADYNRLFLKNTETAYVKFLQGEDNYEEDDEAFISELKKMCNYDEERVAAMENKHRVLMEEVQRLEKENKKDRLETKRTAKIKLQLDIQKICEYRSGIQSFLSNLEEKDAELDDELKLAGNTLESLKVEQARLQELQKKQIYTPADIERINQEKRVLLEAIASHAKSLEQAEQHKWSEEISLAKVKEKAELKLTEYHKLARKLKLIPMSAENACGHDFELKPFQCGPRNIHTKSLTQHLKKLISDLEEDRSRLSNAKFILEQSCEQLNSNILDKENDQKQLKEQIRKVDERLEANQKELARENQEWAMELERVEGNRDLLEEKVNSGYDEAMQQHKALQQEYHLVLLETTEEKRTVSNNLASVFTTAADHLSKTEKFLEEVHSHMPQVFAKAIEDDDKAVKDLKEMLSSLRSKVEKAKK
ncbi:kinetochore protein NDC80 homolog [Syngnathoides biaculeatus]|uniref:kinetochore protein NDC80 homolog n=1 Tax=Syngnathoides biaculeatus TaxID=300417 RepID=UPI002ADE60E1|nr:kinetochore protein NDC80 homolog [Syngnathoides biaculeatus]